MRKELVEDGRRHPGDELSPRNCNEPPWAETSTPASLSVAGAERQRLCSLAQHVSDAIPGKAAVCWPSQRCCRISHCISVLHYQLEKYTFTRSFVT